jgi:hypothetical protein
MRILRYSAAAVTILMALMNLPFALGEGVVGWLVALVGVIGLVAAVALLRRMPGAPWAVTAVGVVNLAGAVLALGLDRDGAAVGLVVSALGTVLGAACLRGPTAQPA